MRNGKGETMAKGLVIPVRDDEPTFREVEKLRSEYLKLSNSYATARAGLIGLIARDDVGLNAKSVIFDLLKSLD